MLLELIKEKGGRCLSESYSNSKTKLLWECAKGHRWEASFTSIKRGTWCPQCAGNTKLTIEDMHKIAMQREGKCLSEKYINSGSKLLWECSHGHQWKAQPNNIKSGKWCPYCSGRLNGSIEELQKIAESRGGKCISEEYINLNTKLLWECSEGHQWESIPKNIKKGSWCPHCAGTSKSTIEEMNQIAEKRGGKCLSEKYKGNKSKLLWECSKGHKWETAPSNVKSGRWCPKCSGKVKFTLDEIREIAEDRGGRCLSDKYANIKGELLWECSEGHRWKTSLKSIQNGSWCPDCGIKRSAESRKKHSIQEIYEFVKYRGGKCLSKEYINPRTPLLWECKYGHQWQAVYYSIKMGTWCPVCSSGLGERICKVFFEQLFSRPFPKSYPKWLVSQGGYQMELDGYNEELKIAFEHHGEQHYSIDNPFIKTAHELKKRQDDDEWKRQLCFQNNVFLIEIPQLTTRTSIYRLKEIIKLACVTHNVQLPEGFDTIVVDLARAYTTSYTENELVTLKELALNKGGRCLADQYINNTTKLLWECSFGHRWYAVPSSIKSGTWCPLCADNAKGSIEEMHQLAKARGGKCLSKQYMNNNYKLLWECSEGHQWKTTPKIIKKGKWCPHCAGVAKYTIEDMKKLAIQKSGKCLSESYVHVHKKLLWECVEGHQWEATPDSINRGTWCPICGREKSAKSKRLTIDEMHLLAENRGGICLSTNYINARTKLLWECKRGHQWEAKPDSIKRGSWCPICSRFKSLR